MTDEVVTRLYRALVEELHRRDHAEDQPVRVSQLYKELVPYQSVRSRLGVELNADYEHALLRLLAGERDLLRLEPAEARKELRREVEAPYPFVGLFRKYAGSKVWVRMPDDEDAPAADEGPERSGIGRGAPSTPSPSSSRGTGSDRGFATRSGTGPAVGGGAAPERAPIRLHTESEASDPETRATRAGQTCPFCDDTLPEGRRVRFCPHCGGDQRLRPCPRCDAVLERGWQYCISCGLELGGD